MKYFIIILLSLFQLNATMCSGGDSSSADRNNLLAVLGLARASSPAPVTVTFQPRFNGQPLNCGGTYTLPSGVSFQLRDARMYVSNPVLVRADGSTTPITVTTNDYQYSGPKGNLVLLDFENLTNVCTVGTSTTNFTISGTALAGSYVGIRFTVGVPIPLNHSDQTSGNNASVPRVVQNGVHPGLAWSWLTGRKFARIEIASSSSNLVYHLGSTGCSGDISQTPGTAPGVVCTNSWRPSVSITRQSGFDPSSNQIVFNMDGLFQQTAAGDSISASVFNSSVSLSCMPANTSGTGSASACATLSRNFGLIPAQNAGSASAVETGIGVMATPSTVNSNLFVIQ